MRKILLAAATVLLIPLLCLSSAADDRTIKFEAKPETQPLAAFVIGTIEANGHLVPIVSFNGSQWAGIDLAEDWRVGRRIETKGEWTLWYETPEPCPDSRPMCGSWISRMAPVEIAISTTGLIPWEPRCIYGDRIFALATDAEDLSESLITCDYCCPEPKRGFATTAKTRPDRVPAVNRQGADGKRITAWVLDTFNELERQRFQQRHYTFDYGVDEFIDTGKTLAEYLEPHLSTEKRRGVPLHYFTSSRIEGAGATYYYFEAKRSYYKHLEREFPSNAYLQGWVRDAGDGPVWMTQEFNVTDPEPKGLGWIYPIFFWRHRNLIYVLVKYSEWESGGFRVLRIAGDDVKVLIGGGHR